jgi:hypothetical protein
VSTKSLGSLVTTLLLLWHGLALAARPLDAQSTPGPAVPVEPIGAIVNAFATHDLVALSDAHGNDQAHAFLKALIRDPRFANAVNDIVVEFGNARYQHLVDRYVRGEHLPIDSVRVAWQNTTIANEIPVDEEFFSTVRSVNATRPRERQLRVLLADPPIDWSVVVTREDHFKWLSLRDSYPAALIVTEVLAKQRRALVVYGHLHFQRKNLFSNLDMSDWRMQTIVSLLESSTPARVFSVWRFGDEMRRVQPDAASWPVPSLAVLRGTTLGAADMPAFTPIPARFEFQGERRVQVPRERWRTLRAEDQFDAVLYLGPSAAMTQTPLSPRICADSSYVRERLRRITLTGIPRAEADRVAQLCARSSSPRDKPLLQSQNVRAVGRR